MTLDNTPPRDSSPLSRVLARLEGVRKQGSQFVAHCPAHDDATPSLSIREADDGRVLVHCHARCTYTEIIAAIGIKPSETFASSDRSRERMPAKGASRSKMTAEQAQEIYRACEARAHDPETPPFDEKVWSFLASRNLERAIERRLFGIMPFDVSRLPVEVHSWRESWPLVEALYSKKGVLTNLQARAVSPDIDKDKRYKNLPGRRVSGSMLANNVALAVQRKEREVGAVIITEGATDFLAVGMAAPESVAVVSVPGTSNATATAGPWMKGAKLLLLLDCDGPGKTAAIALAQASSKYGPESITIGEWPEGHEDACEFLNAAGVEGLTSFLARAVSVVQSGEDAGGFTTYELPAFTRQKIDIGMNTRLVEQVDAAELGILQNAKKQVFQRAGRLVQVVYDNAKRQIKTLRRDERAPIIAEASEAWIHELIDFTSDFGQIDNKGKFIPCRPPREISKTLLARNTSILQPLEAMSMTPIIRMDGDVQTHPGYDEQTGVLFISDDAWPSVPANPTAAEVQAALGHLCSPFVDFPFAGPADLSVVLSAILTTIARELICGATPLHAFGSPTPGCGKTLIADVVSIIATGHSAATHHPSQNSEEMRKLLLALGRCGDAMVLFDNVVGLFGSGALAMALTGTTIKDRVLGGSDIGSFPLRPTWMCTGNNIVFRGDLGRRVLQAQLLPMEEHPENRSGFVHDPLLEFVARERKQLVTSALILLRYHAVAGRPPHGGPKYGSFEEWDDMVRSCLIYAGAADPCATRKAVSDDADDDLERVRALYEGLRSAFSLMPFTCKEAIERARPNSDLSDALSLFEDAHGGGRPDSVKLGYILRSIKGRAVGGLRLMKVQQPCSSKKAAQWILEDLAQGTGS